MSALITTETFHEIPVRIVQGENGPIIPLVDIAHGIDHDPYELIRMYERNLELLKDDSQTVMMTTGNQVAERGHVCLTRDGVIGILMKMDYRRVRKEGKKEKIIAFQKWAIATLGQVMDGKVQPSQPLLPPLSDALREEMARADALVLVGVDRSMAASVCMAKLEDEYHTDLSYLRNLLTRSDDRDIAYLTATAIGKKFDLSSQSVNNILESAGYQKHGERVKKNGSKKRVWNLTDKGKRFGEIHIGRYGGTETYVVMWRDSILQEFERVLFNREKSKQGLLLGEIGVGSVTSCADTRHHAPPVHESG